MVTENRLTTSGLPSIPLIKKGELGTTPTTTATASAGGGSTSASNEETTLEEGNTAAVAAKKESEALGPGGEGATAAAAAAVVATASAEQQNDADNGAGVWLGSWEREGLRPLLEVRLSVAGWLFRRRSILCFSLAFLAADGSSWCLSWRQTGKCWDTKGGRSAGTETNAARLLGLQHGKRTQGAGASLFHNYHIDGQAAVIFGPGLNCRHFS